MNLLAYFRSFAAKLFRPSRINDDTEEELRSHIQHRADDLERSGLNRDEAEQRAHVEFGGHGRFKEECHEALGGNFIATLIQDVRFSLRVLRKAPSFSAIAIRRREPIVLMATGNGDGRPSIVGFSNSSAFPPSGDFISRSAHSAITSSLSTGSTIRFSSPAWSSVSRKCWNER